MRKYFFMPSPGDVLRELDCARIPKSKVHVWSQSFDPIDSIGQPLSITVGRNTTGGRDTHDISHNFHNRKTKAILFQITDSNLNHSGRLFYLATSHLWYVPIHALSGRMALENVQPGNSTCSILRRKGNV